jgi:hypothetical protein
MFNFPKRSNIFLQQKYLEKRQGVRNSRALKNKTLHTKPLPLMDANVVEIFYHVDEFSKQFDKAEEGHPWEAISDKKTRDHKFTMSDSEVMTTLRCFS